MNDDDQFSDHKLLSFTVGGGGGVTPSVESLPRFRVRDADWQQFETELLRRTMELSGNQVDTNTVDDAAVSDDLLTTWFGAVEDLESAVGRFTDVISDVCRASIPMKATSVFPSMKKSVPWWSQELTTARRELRAARRLYQRTRNNVALREHRRQTYWSRKQQFKDQVKQAKFESWKNYCSTEGTQMPWGPIYKAAAGKRKTTLGVTTLQKHNGELTGGLQDTLELIMGTCVPSETVPYSQHHERVRMEADTYLGESDDVPFTLSEVRAVIHGFVGGKSPGEDGMTEEILSKAVKSLLFGSECCTADIINCSEERAGDGMGSCSGPGFWIILYNSLLELPFESGVEVFAYADDLLLICTAKDEYELERRANTALYMVERWAWENNLVYNPLKTQVLRISRRRKTRELSVYLMGERLQFVNQLKYLGVMFDGALRWTKHIQYVCGKASQLINILSRAAKMHWGLGPEALGIIYRGAIVPIILYAVPVWVEALRIQRNVDSLRRVQRLMLLRMIRGVRTTSFHACCIVSGEKPIDVEAKENADIHCGLAGESVDKPLPPDRWLHPAEVPTPEVDFEEAVDLTFAIYTDGSDMGQGRVGCAFVVYTGLGALLYRERFRLGASCSNNQAELLAIMKSLE
ncbi:hypothetical protein GE061_013489 [Apolygus lucorum]|uniref:RNase H type-1 domain-containing protein n=1 Tax=Apolygus lucorum TaxID=248454 RepID=A0A8S9XS04_APOLU|nr:hypothetical protein GE061_013489 [Apolygus lucorum]